MISIIMSTYSEPIEILDEAVRSTLDQTEVDFEFLIVLDNPNNLEIKSYLKVKAAEDKRIKLIHNEKNMGLAMSLNKALKVSTGEYIVRADADDISYPHRLKTQLKYLKDNELDFLSSNGNYFGKRTGKVLSEFITRNYNTLIKYSNVAPHNTWFVRREVYDKLEGYRDIGPAQDYEFISRVLQSGFKVGNLDEALVQYRWSDGNISSKNRFLQQYNCLRSQIAIKKKIDFFDVNSNLLNISYWLTLNFYKILNISSDSKSPPKHVFSRFFKKVNFLTIIHIKNRLLGSIVVLLKR